MDQARGGRSSKRRTAAWPWNAARGPVPDLVLLDLMMPEMNGFEFLEAVRKLEAWRAVPVVVITAKNLTDDDRHRLNGGVERVVAEGALGSRGARRHRAGTRPGSRPRAGRSPMKSSRRAAPRRSGSRMQRHDMAHRQAALLRLSTAIAAATDEHAVYGSMVNGLHDEALGYNFLGLFLLDEATGDRVLQASVGWPDVPLHWRVHRGTGLERAPARRTGSSTTRRT